MNYSVLMLHIAEIAAIAILMWSHSSRTVFLLKRLNEVVSELNILAARVTQMKEEMKK